MKIKKKFLKLLLDILSQGKHKLVEARFRDRIAKKVSEEYQTYEEERVKLCINFCTKDKEKQPILKDNQYQFTDAAMVKFQKEFALLLDEEVKFVLEGDENTRLHRLITATDYTPALGEATVIEDEIIEKVRK